MKQLVVLVMEHHFNVLIKLNCIEYNHLFINLYSRGFIPVEIYKHYLSTNLQKRTSQCQRCSLFSYTNPISHCQVNEHIYRDILTEIKRKRALIILIVDLLDITNSISRSWTHLVDQTTDYHNTSPNIIFVLGNKVDLLPKCRFVCNYK
ncbi:unnamed protein product [Rotaria sp. Silwood1]|nr:unnamed protein product [Rotaria sp. Silwood1]